MGKSSLYVLAAVLWALGRPFFGIRPNGCLRSLLIQSEDSDGDIAEVWVSILAELKLSAADVAAVRDRVRVVTDRQHRGTTFIAQLRAQISAHKPDLVWINPLMAFLDGDIKEAKETGQFLREGLNGLNSACEFGYMIVHHTVKPPNAKDKAERNWSEVMYDMAGSADLINWARLIMSLRPTDQQGQFNLVLAKRGTRAGVVKAVVQGAGIRHEIQTTIPLRHSTERVTLPSGESIHSLMWHDREPDAPKVQEKSGRPRKCEFSELRTIFPISQDKAERRSVLFKRANELTTVKANTFNDFLADSVQAGLISRTGDPVSGWRYHLAPAP